MKNKLSARFLKTAEQRDQIVKFFDALVSIAVLIMSVQSLIRMTSPVPVVNMLLFLSMSASSVMSAIRERNSRARLVFRIVCAVAYAALGIVIIVMQTSLTGLMISGAVFFTLLTAGRVISIFCKRKLRSTIINSLLALLLLLIGLSYGAIGEAERYNYSLILYLLVAAMTLIHIILISFSQIRIDVLRKIIRKTYAAEILFGLSILIVSFSFILTALETSIPTFGDALWYCFAVVTTIGFGDLAAASLIGRVLSVILGIYGIVVVSLITSIIVNFYSEIKNEREDQPDENPAEEKAGDKAEEKVDEKTVDKPVEKPENAPEEQKEENKK